jgi:hypothetical protein
MNTLETDAEVGADGSLKLRAPLPSWLKPGRRHLVLMVEEISIPSPSRDSVACLREIAREGGLGISDPVAWQREQRRGRSLPGRES